MSLRAFHIAFIACSVVMSVLFGVWCLQQYQAGGSILYAMTGGAAVVCGALLAVYGGRFIHRTRHLGLL